MKYIAMMQEERDLPRPVYYAGGVWLCDRSVAVRYNTPTDVLLAMQGFTPTILPEADQ